MSNKRERFVTLAEKRVNRTIQDMRLIGNLANPHNYDYTEDDARKIIAALESELKLVRNRFVSRSVEERPEFKL